MCLFGFLALDFLMKLCYSLRKKRALRFSCCCRMIEITIIHESRRSMAEKGIMMRKTCVNNLRIFILSDMRAVCLKVPGFKMDLGRWLEYLRQKCLNLKERGLRRGVRESIRCSQS